MKNLTLMAAIIASGGPLAAGGHGKQDYTAGQLAKLALSMAGHILEETGDDPDELVSIETTSAE